MRCQNAKLENKHSRFQPWRTDDDDDESPRVIAERALGIRDWCNMYGVNVSKCLDRDVWRHFAGWLAILEAPLYNI